MWLFLISYLVTLRPVDSEAVSIALHIHFKVSLLKCVWAAWYELAEGGS